MTKSQMAFVLPDLSYIDTIREEPEVQQATLPTPRHGFASWIAERVEAVRARRANARALAELRGMTDRELTDVGLNRGDFDRVFDSRFNQDMRSLRHVP
jgi:uncharacterized protein YjiS (DUF1127 family)